MEVPLGLVAGHPLNATDCVGQEEFVGLQERLGREGAFVHLDSVVQGGANQHGAHDASHAPVVQAWGVEHAIGHHEQVGPGGLDDFLVRVQNQGVAPTLDARVPRGVDVDRRGDVLVPTDGRHVLVHVLVDVHVEPFGRE